MRNLIFFDIETTGIEPKKGAEVLEMAALKCNMQNCMPWSRLQTMVQPKNGVPEVTQKINHITNGMVKYAAPINEALSDMFNYISEDDILVGHNIIKFDIPFVEYFLGKKINNEKIDTLLLAKDLGFKRGERSQEKLAKHFKIKYPSQAHRALADVEVNRRIYKCLNKMKQGRLF